MNVARASKKRKGSDRSSTRTYKKAKLVIESFEELCVDRAIHISRKIRSGSSALDSDLHKGRFEVALDACYVLAQNAGGSAVCISPKGLILTNCHCLMTDTDSDDTNRTHVGKQRVLVNGSGDIVLGVVAAADIKRDLAVLQVVKIFNQESNEFLTTKKGHTFSYVSLFKCDRSIELCEEAKSFVEKSSYIPTGLPVVCLGVAAAVRSLAGVGSFGAMMGKILGVVDYSNIHDNSTELGQLEHSCPTYWGTSGAPLFSQDGTLVGLHNSYDTRRFTHHAVHLAAIRAFMRNHKLP